MLHLEMYTIHLVQLTGLCQRGTGKCAQCAFPKADAMQHGTVSFLSPVKHTFIVLHTFMYYFVLQFGVRHYP